MSEPIFYDAHRRIAAAIPVLLLMSFLFSARNASAAQVLYSPSPLSNSFDRVADLARPSAMGSAMAGVADDATALVVNPGGLGFLEQGQLSVNSDLWLAGTFQERAIAAFPLTGLGALAFSAAYLDYGAFEGRDEAGSLASSYGADRIGLGIGWGREVTQDLALGLSLQGSQNTYAGVGSTSLSSNFGLLWKGPQGWRVGAAYLGLAWLSPGGASASSLDLGVSDELALDGGQGLLVAVSGSWEPKGASSLQAGMEYGFQRRLFLRVGYQFPLSDPLLGGFSGLTAGVGFQLSGLTVDYAFLPYGDLGASHRISLGYSFGGAPSTGEGPALSTTGQTQDDQDGARNKKSHNLDRSGKSTSTEGPSDGPTKASSKKDGSTAVTTGPAATGKTPSSLDPLAKAPPASSSKEPKAAPSVTADKDSLVLQFDLPDDEGAASPGAGAPTSTDISQLQQAAENYPKDPAVWWKLGNAYRLSGQKAKAVPCFEKVLQLRPNNPQLADWLKKYKAAQP